VGGCRGLTTDLLVRSDLCVWLCAAQVQRRDGPDGCPRPATPACSGGDGTAACLLLRCLSGAGRGGRMQLQLQCPLFRSMEYTARGLLRASTASVTCSFLDALHHDDIRSERANTLAASAGSACASQMDRKMCSGAFAGLIVVGLSGGVTLVCVRSSLLCLSPPLELAHASRPRL
jgi:hypothetical protein